MTRKIWKKFYHIFWFLGIKGNKAGAIALEFLLDQPHYDSRLRYVLSHYGKSEEKKYKSRFLYGVLDLM